MSISQIQSNFSFQNIFSDIHFFEILDKIDAGIAIYNASGNYIFVNRALINWRNLSRKQFMNMNVHDFDGMMDICVFDLVKNEKKMIRRLQYYQNIQDPSTAPRVRVVTGSPIFDEYGEVGYVVVMMQDVKDFEDEYKRLIQEHHILATPRLASIQSENDDTLVAESPEIKAVLQVAENISSLDSTVLLFGESGTGKEVFAHFIHNHSGRKNKPLITVNCASIPENLIEAELFGYEKGSFTGANREGKIGLVESADGGTLFLDEINSLPLNMQGKILRTIEDKSIQRIGSLKVRKVDFRLIVATNRNLARMVSNGSFREDLYYRLNVIPLEIPPLRLRRTDIEPLSIRFLAHFCHKYNLKKALSPAVIRKLEAYSWPGNVRELRNVIERAVVMTPYSMTEINDLPDNLLLAHEKSTRAPENETYFANTIPQKLSETPSPKSSLTKERILEALAAHGGRRADTAAALGISRRYLQYKIHEYHISSRCRYN